MTPPETQRSSDAEEFFKRLLDKDKPDPNRSGPGEEAMAAALQAIQGFAAKAEAQKEKPSERPTDDSAPDKLAACSACGHHNRKR